MRYVLVVVVVLVYKFSTFSYVSSYSNPYASESTCRSRQSPSFLRDLKFQCPLPISRPSLPVEVWVFYLFILSVFIPWHSALNLNVKYPFYAVKQRRWISWSGSFFSKSGSFYILWGISFSGKIRVLGYYWWLAGNIERLLLLSKHFPEKDDFFRPMVHIY